MMIGDDPIGVINCYTEEGRVFTKNEIQLVQTIANHAALAIEHMRVVAEQVETKTALETRKSLDQAKRILIHRYRMQEENAHRLLQKMSMERNKSIKEVSDAIILAAELPKA
jgi:uroporphyrinogen-III synthase